MAGSTVGLSPPSGPGIDAIRGGGGGEGYCESETVSREHAFDCQLAEVRSRETIGKEMRAGARDTADQKVDARCIKERTSIVER